MTRIVDIDAMFLFHAPGVAPERVPARLKYERRDPYAVTIVFRTGLGPVEWIFARNLLDVGLLIPSGDGNIVVRPCHADETRVFLDLAAPAGSAVLSADARELATFLDLTYDLVPPGGESRWIDIDDALSRLVATD